MIRDIIQIDEEKCTGCGLCVAACQEGALAMVDGKARLVSESYCDGLGACLPECPSGAIQIVKREAAGFVEPPLPCGCPGTQSRSISRPEQPVPAHSSGSAPAGESELRQWPVQLKLSPVQAPWYSNARLLIAADCTAYARAGFHAEFMRGRVTLIGCPKLDAGDYTAKLTEIFKMNAIKSIMVVKMEVPCCGASNAQSARLWPTAAK